MPNSYIPCKGHTLLIPSGSSSSPDKKHLFLASASTIRAGIAYDATCEIAPGEHPFIQAASYILYARPAKLRHEGIIKCVAAAFVDEFDPGRFQRATDSFVIGFSHRWLTVRWLRPPHRSNANLPIKAIDK
jgi:hypothetical protein